MYLWWRTLEAEATPQWRVVTLIMQIAAAVAVAAMLLAEKS